VAALNFTVFHRHADRVKMTNIAQMVNVLQAMILTQGPQMVLTPTYHVFRMFRPFQDATFLPTEVQAPRYLLGPVSVPMISASAARTKQGTIIVSLVNLQPNMAIPLSLTIAGATAQHVSGEILTSAAMDARNTFDNPDAVTPAPFNGATLNGTKLTLTLPAKSVVVVSLE
jgi:alpha-N-arabinofuranosidase